MTELIVSLGANTFANLSHPDQYNPYGYFESRELNGVNERLLEFAGSSWNDTSTVLPDFGMIPALDSMRLEVRQLLHDNHSSSELFVMKDPRMSLLQSFYTDVIAFDATIICVRRPCCVATSLNRRNGISFPQGVELWFRYTMHAIQAQPDALLVDPTRLESDHSSIVKYLIETNCLRSPEVDKFHSLIKDRAATRSAECGCSNVKRNRQINLAMATYHLLLTESGVPLADLAQAILPLTENPPSDEILQDQDLLQEKTRALDSEVRILNQTIKTLERNARHEHLKQQELETNLSNVKADYENELSNVKADYENELSDLKETIEAQELRATLDENLRRHLEDRLSEQIREVSGTETKLDLAQRELRSLSAANNQLSAANHELSFELEEEQKRSSKYELSLNETKAAYAEHRRRYRLFRKRKSVRLSLYLSRSFKPLFWVKRRLF